LRIVLFPEPGFPTRARVPYSPTRCVSFSISWKAACLRVRRIGAARTKGMTKGLNKLMLFMLSIWFLKKTQGWG
jgi:hypothetical protein